MPEAGAERTRLLVSANDPGAAFHLCEILKYANEIEGLECFLVAGASALAVFERSGFDAWSFAAGRVGLQESEGVADNLAEADAIIARFRPDAILVGLSGPDRGMDEALLSRAGELPTYAIQDFWGDVNPGFGKLPDTYFVLDELAAKYTSLRAPASRIIVSGSARHASFSGIDMSGFREEFRSWTGHAGAGPIAVFLGQPLWEWPGYGLTLTKAAESLVQVTGAASMRYRPHPKETDSEKDRALACLAAAGLQASVDDSSALEVCLGGADLLLTCYSTCGLDFAYLNRESKTPLGAILFLLFDEDIGRVYRESTCLNEMPLSELSLATTVWREDLLAGSLRDALAGGEREAKWKAAREKLADPSEAAERIVKTIIDDLSGVSGSAED